MTGFCASQDVEFDVAHGRPEKKMTQAVMVVPAMKRKQSDALIMLSMICFHFCSMRLHVVGLNCVIIKILRYHGVYADAI